MDYPGLKKLLKGMTTAPGPSDVPDAPLVPKPITDEDEERFQTEMRHELEKVVAFHRLKTEELRRRIDDAERIVESILANQQASDDERKRKTDEVLKEMDKISNEVNQMSRYNRLNYSGFQKVRANSSCSVRSTDLTGIESGSYVSPDAEKARQIHRTLLQAHL